MEKLTSLQVSEFLKDYEKKSEIVILEEGKEKNELIESAKKRGIIISKNDLDLGVLKTIYAFTDKANANGAILPSKEFQKVFPKIIGRPMNINHERQRTVGFYIDYKYIVKEHKAITYAIFFKSNYPAEWDHAKALQKKGKLSSSFEIWSPKNKRKDFSNGTYELHDMTPAGGALIFEEDGNAPAFKDAKVLKIAKKEVESYMDEKNLVFASKMKTEDIIVADQFKESIKENLEKIKVEKEVQSSKKIKCGNCEHEFEINPLDEKKCPKCFAILNENGEVVYPPQIIDFKTVCPSCKINSWRILKKKEESYDVKCLGCAKEYNLVFSIDKLESDFLKKFIFLYEGNATCHQCGKVIHFSQLSNAKEKVLTCPRCGLTFEVEIYKSKYKKIKSINEIKVDLKKSSKGGENEMEFKLEISKYHRYFEGNIDEFMQKLHKSYDEQESPEIAKRLTFQERKALPDSSFAVVVRVKDKRTGDTRKVRMFPINDEAHVRNALARLGQPAPKATLKRLGVSLESVKTKILRRAKQLKMTELLERQKASKLHMTVDINKIVESKKEKLYKADIKKLADEITAMKEEDVTKVEDYQKVIMEYEKELASLYEKKDKELEEAKNEVNFYKDNAKIIHERREELGEDYAKDLSDKDIINEDKYELAKARKENDELAGKKIETASEIVGDKGKNDDLYAKRQKKINKLAFKSKDHI